jgi:hypothetical protein
VTGLTYETAVEQLVSRPLGMVPQPDEAAERPILSEQLPDEHRPERAIGQQDDRELPARSASSAERERVGTV